MLGIALVLALGFGVLCQVVKHIDRNKAEDESLRWTPIEVAQSALVFIKCTGAPPSNVMDCIAIEPNEVPPHLEGLGYVPMLTAFGKTFAHHRVLRGLRLSFPSTPESLEVREGRLVCRNTGAPTPLVSLQGEFLYDPNLALLNLYLWESWLKLSRGGPTDDQTVNVYDCNDPTWLRILASDDRSAGGTIGDAREP